MVVTIRRIFVLGFLLMFVATLGGAASAQDAVKWTPVTEDRLLQADQDGANWLTHHRTYNGWRYSPLNQINDANVGKLSPRWMFPGGGAGDQKGTPMVNDGVMVTVAIDAGDTVNPRTLIRQRVYALDATTGAVLWKHEHKLPEDLTLLVRILLGPRGVAFLKDRVYYGTKDARLVALKATTGEVIWTKEIADYKDGFYVSMAPIVAKGKLVVGIAGPGEMGNRGFIEAFDPDTGRSLWRTYTIPGPGEPGNDTWAGESWKVGGAAPWHHGTYDPDSNTLFYGTGNPAPWIPELRKGDNLWANSVIALDADTGQMKWGYQFVPNEGWDLDTNQEPLVIDVTRDGTKRNAVIQANKLGYVYTLDRTDGTFISATPFVKLRNWGEVHPKTGKVSINRDAVPTMGGARVEVCPGLVGATSWGNRPYNPQTGLMYIPSNEFCMMLGYAKEITYKRGSIFTGAAHDHYAKGDYSGVLRAYDVNADKIVWEWSTRSPLVTHVLTTAGNLVFFGTAEGKVIGLDARRGKPLWEFSVGTPISGGLMTYAVGGKQYLAVAAGGQTRSATYYSKEPRWAHLKNVPWSDVVVVFALPD
jgi:alcohol dehydrogenase (cytochrome c)